MGEASSQTPIYHPADLGGFLKILSLACLVAARRWHTSWPVCLGRADGCQTEQEWLWAQLYPSLVLARAGGWGLPVCLPAGAAGRRAGGPKIKGSSGYGPTPLPLATTTPHDTQPASDLWGLVCAWSKGSKITGKHSPRSRSHRIISDKYKLYSPNATFRSSKILLLQSLIQGMILQKLGLTILSIPYFATGHST